MVERTNRTTQQKFWGCPDWPRCTSRPLPTDLDTLHTTLRELTRERDTLQLGYDRLLAEVRQLRRLKAPPTLTAAALVRELTRVLALVHPDKWGGESTVALECTKQLVALRAKIQEGRL
jgi:hypothetical protein